MKAPTLRIALLEDNSDYAENVATMLGSDPPLSARLTTHGTLSEFLGNAGDLSAIDVILIDLNLPDSGGLDTFVEVEKAFPGVPKIVLSALDDNSLSERILALGAHDFIQKSQVNPDLLKRVISFAVIRNDYQQRLVAKSEQFQMAAKLARLGSYEVDLEPMKIHWSDEVCDIHGVDPGFVPGLDTALDFYIPEHRTEVAKAFTECVENGTPFSGEWKIITAKGNHTWMRVIGDCIRDSTGKIAKVHGTLQDVTERFHDQTSLRLLQECIRNLNDSVMICDASILDEPGPRILFVNEAFEKLTGYSINDVRGKTPRILQGPKTDKNTLREIRQALEVAEPIRRELFNYGKNGDSYWVEIEISPIFDKGGVLRNFVGVQRDITERKIQENTASFQARILDTVSQSVLVTDNDGIITYANVKAEEYFGFPSKDLIGQLITDATVADVDLKRSYEVLAKVQLGEEWVGEIQAKHSSGKEFPVLVSACAIYDEDGNLDKMLAFATDISERREIEKALRRSLKDTLDLKQALDRHVILSTLDPDGKLLSVNEKFCAVSGYSEEELVGRPYSILNSGYHTSDFFTEMFDTLAAGRSWNGEIMNRDKQGGCFWTETTAFPILDDEGNPQQYLFLRSDISDRKKAEEELRFQASFISRSYDAILANDLDHRISFWNQSAERIYGWTAEEAIGQLNHELLHDDSQEYFDAVEAVLENGEWSGELKQVTKSGEEILIKASWTLIAGAGARTDAIFSINKDITDRRELEKQFYRSQRMESVGRLAGGIAHDLNNMLTPILMSVDVLREEGINESTSGVLDLLEGSASRATDLVKQVLMFSRGVDGKRSRVSVGEVVGEIESIAKETFPKNVTVNVTLDDNLEDIVGDKTQIHQILMNLSVNARDAMEDGGHLALHAGNVSLDAEEADAFHEVSEGNYVVISVQDTGSGMPSDVIDKIFDPFFTTKEIGKGSGIGLSTCLAIARSHGGFMDVRSEVGKGTQFKVYLPVSDSDIGEDSASLPVDDIPTGRGELILFVDDEAAIRTMGRRILESAGYRAVTAKNGAEAAALYAKQSDEICVVVTDMAMPIMDGNTLIIALRTIEPNVRIIATSGHTTSGKYLGNGTDEIEYFVPKPFSAETLLPVLTSVVAKGKQESVALAN